MYYVPDGTEPDMEIDPDEDKKFQLSGGAVNGNCYCFGEVNSKIATLALTV